MRILSIDIGYNNMGLVLAECPLKGPKIHVEFVKKVNLEDYKHVAPTNEIADLVPLFVEDHAYIFDAAERILIERQPPGGFTNIQTLLHYMFRDRVVLVSPVSMHTHFGMRHLDYEQRKERVESIAERHVEGGIPYDRKHDIADAICMLLYYNFRSGVHIFDTYRFQTGSALPTPTPRGRL